MDKGNLGPSAPSGDRQLRFRRLGLSVSLLDLSLGQAPQRAIRGSLDGAVLNRQPQQETCKNSAVPPQEFPDHSNNLGKSPANVLKKTAKQLTRAHSNLKETTVEEQATHEREHRPRYERQQLPY